MSAQPPSNDARPEPAPSAPPASASPSRQDVERRIAQALGARHAWLCELPPARALAAALGAEGEVGLAQVLDGSPVRCLDLRELGRQARAAGRPLVVDATPTGLRGCASVRLGAQLALLSLDETSCALAVSKDAERVLPGLVARLDQLPRMTGEAAASAFEWLAAEAMLWDTRSDAAQVIAAYLRCHPKVAQLRYPGLREDPSFEVAARTLQHGFGPLIDLRLVSDGGWRRISCSAGDVREQVMALEDELAR